MKQKNGDCFNMKIRTSYVSNSSSSFFIILGNTTTNPLQSIKDGKNVIVYIEACGTSGDVGDWCINLTPEIYDIITNHKWFKPYAKPIYYELAEGTSVIYDEEKHDDILIVDNNVSNAELFAFNKDYSCPENIDELKEFLERN